MADSELDFSSAIGYASASQRVRVMTELWAGTHAYCPNCWASIEAYRANAPVADFSCPRCAEVYELKSKKGALGAKVVDGAYASMIRRLTEDDNPNFFFLSYEATTLRIRDFMVVPKHFFTSDIIEERPPLSATAQRAGWVGCNILLSRVPQAWRISYIRDGVPRPRESVLSQWRDTLFLRTQERGERGWLLDVMACVDRLGAEFTLEDVYQHESYLAERHPANLHVKDKVRQQLQVLRDKGYLEFLGRWRYRRRYPT